MDKLPIYVLDENLRVVCLLSNELPKALPVIEDLYTASLDDGTCQVNLTTILGHRFSDSIKVGNYIYYPTPNTNNKVFRIIETEENRGATPTISFVSELSAYQELIEDIVRPVKFNSATIEEIIEHILIGTDWTYENEIVKTIDFEISEYVTKLQAIRLLQEYIDAEIDFLYDMNNNKIVKKTILITEEINLEVARFIYRGKDLLDIRRTIDDRDVVTNMIGVGGAKDGVTITLANLQISEEELPPGFEKPYGADYIYNREAQSLYGGERIGIYTNTEVKSQKELFYETLKALKEAMKPKVKYEVNIAYLDTSTGGGRPLILGRYIYINDTTVEPAIALRSRIRQISTSIYNPSVNSVVLGDYKEYDVSKNELILQMQDKIAETEEEWNKTKWDMFINSTNGFTFNNGLGETKLSIIVTKAGLEYDSLGGELDYVWRRYDERGNQIPISGVGGSTLEIQGKELLVYANYLLEDLAIYEGQVSISDYLLK